jgi:hypothetical protein
MTTPKEVEIKLELAPASLPQFKKIPLIRALKAPARQATEVSVYFDTDTHKLRKHGLMLRVRRGNRIQTIKATGNSGLFERDEWENEIASKRLIDLARGTVERSSATASPPAQADVRDAVRRTVYLSPMAPTPSLTVDQGKIDTGAPGVVRDRARARARQPNELFEIAREITRALPAQLGLKSRNAAMSCRRRARPPVKAAAVDFAPVRARDA